MKRLVLKQQTSWVVTCLTIVLSCGGIRFSFADDIDEMLTLEEMRERPTDLFMQQLKNNTKGDGPVAVQINFATASSMIGKAGKRYLKEIGKSLAQYYFGNDTLYIYGHTDSAGTNKTNLKLSRKRAQSVARFLIDFGLSKKNVVAFGCGEKKLRVTPETTPRDKARNRRVEFALKQYEDYSDCGR